MVLYTLPAGAWKPNLDVTRPLTFANAIGSRLHRPGPVLLSQWPAAVRRHYKRSLDVWRRDAGHEDRRLQVEDHVDFQRQVRGHVYAIVPQAQAIVGDQDRVVAEVQAE